MTPYETSMDKNGEIKKFERKLNGKEIRTKKRQFIFE